MINHIMAVVLVIITAVLNLLFIDKIYTKFRLNKQSVGLFIISIAIYVASALFLSSLIYLKLLLNFVVDIIVMALVFKISIKKSSLINALFYGIDISIEMIAMVMFQHFSKMWDFADITNTNGAFIIELLCQMIMLLIIIIISAIKKSSNLSQMDIKGWIAFIVFPVITIVMIIMMIYGSSAEIMNRMFIKLLVLSISMLFMNLMLFYLLDNVIERENEIHEKQILIEQSEHTNKMYRSLYEEREKQKAKSHDYLNHLNVMLKMAEEGNREEEIAYIREQIGNEIDSIDMIDTGNAIINAVLNIKYQEAKKKGIVFPLVADNLSNLSISDSDLVTILTNILDNAIEAVSGINDKKIVMKIVRNKESLCIDASNPFVGGRDIDKPRYTTKEDSLNHGYGIANIRRVVQSNDGDCFIEMRDGIFHMTILLPLS